MLLALQRTYLVERPACPSQTAGGLLAGIPAEQADACLTALLAAGYRAAEIGVVDIAKSAKPVVRLDTHCLEPRATLAAAQ